MLITNEVEALAEARRLVDVHHAGKKYGEHDYSFHTEQVYDTVTEAGLPLEERLAALLHDTFEDTEQDKEALKLEVRTKFGEVVYQLVWAVTGEGANRAERKKSMTTKLRAFVRAINIKLADRYRNMRKCLEDGNKKMFDMYLAEMPDYEDLFALADPYLQKLMSELLERAAIEFAI